MLLAAAVAQGISPRIKVPVELLLLLGSIGVSLIPGVPYISVPPDLIFYVFLPPILFSAAFFTSQRDFLQNLRPIFLLAVGLILATTLAVGYLMHWLFPSIPLPVAMLFGAIVSPPDAAAAAAFAKQLQLPRRVVTILEGESLLNDATALVAFRFAMAAVVSGTFSLPQAVGSFFMLAVGGAAIGLCLSYVALQLVRVINNATGESLISFVTAFLAFLLAEKFHLSGVISTVCAGLYFSRHLPLRSNAETRLEAGGAWRVVLLAINGIIFTIIGLQLPTVLSAAFLDNPLKAVVALGWIVLVLCAVRFLWVFVVAFLSYGLFPSVRKNEPKPKWKNLTLISWSGMRGIVTLATVLAIPETLPDGSPFPYRMECFLLSYGVIIVTLIVPSLTLPLMVRRMKLPAEVEHEREQYQARLAMAEGVLHLLQECSDASPEYQTRLLDRYHVLAQRMKSNLDEQLAHSPVTENELGERRNILRVLATERRVLHTLRHQKKLHDEIFHLLERELDIEEIRLKRNVRPMI